MSTIDNLVAVQGEFFGGSVEKPKNPKITEMLYDSRSIFDEGPLSPEAIRTEVKEMKERDKASRARFEAALRNCRKIKDDGAGYPANAPQLQDPSAFETQRTSRVESVSDINFSDLIEDPKDKPQENPEEQSDYEALDKATSTEEVAAIDLDDVELVEDPTTDFNASDLELADLLLCNFKNADNSLCDVACPRTVKAIQNIKNIPAIVLDLVNVIKDHRYPELKELVSKYKDLCKQYQVDSLFAPDGISDYDKYFDVLESEEDELAELTADLDIVLLGQFPNIDAAVSVAENVASHDDYKNVSDSDKRALIHDAVKRRINSIVLSRLQDSVVDDVMQSTELLDKLRETVKNDVLADIESKMDPTLGSNSADDSDSPSKDDSDSSLEEGSEDTSLEEGSEDTSLEEDSEDSTKEESPSDVESSDVDNLANALAQIIKDPSLVSKVTENTSDSVKSVVTVASNLNKVVDCSTELTIPKSPEELEAEKVNNMQELLEGVAILCPTDVAVRTLDVVGNVLIVNKDSSPKILLPRKGYTAATINQLCNNSIDSFNLLKTLTVEFSKFKQAAAALNKLNLIEPLFQKEVGTQGWSYNVKPACLPESAPSCGKIYPAYDNSVTSGMPIEIEGVPFKIIACS